MLTKIDLRKKALIFEIQKAVQDFKFKIISFEEFVFLLDNFILKFNELPIIKRDELPVDDELDNEEFEEFNGIRFN